MTKILNTFKNLRKTQIAYSPIPTKKMEKFNKLPGHNPASKNKPYRNLLMTKQAVKYFYGFRNETAFHNLFKKAVKEDKIEVIKVFQTKLEFMLSTIIFRIAKCTVRQARQLINHQFISVNGSKVDIPMYEVKQSDIIEISKCKKLFPNIEKVVLPNWIKRHVNKDNDKISWEIKTKTIDFDKDKGFLMNIDFSMLIRFYSR